MAVDTLAAWTTRHNPYYGQGEERPAVEVVCRPCQNQAVVTFAEVEGGFDSPRDTKDIQAVAADILVSP